MKLYILGNGFDLRHDLPTGYGNFYEFAKDVLDEVEFYFHIDLGNAARPWHDFEMRLGTYNWRYLYDEHNHLDVRSEAFKPSHVYGLQDELVERADELVDAIRAQFQEWVEGIDISAVQQRMAFDPGSRFITFNYTQTLQEVYGVEDKDVLHIHGRAGKDELSFGHGVHIEEEAEFNAESGESNRTMFSDAEGSAKYPLYAFQKPVEIIVERNRSFFASLRDVTEIVVIGHSLNDVDLPYFRAIANGTTKSRWIVYCFEESDWDHHVQQLVGCGVNQDRIFPRPYDN